MNRRTFLAGGAAAGLSSLSGCIGISIQTSGDGGFFEAPEVPTAEVVTESEYIDIMGVEPGRLLLFPGDVIFEVREGKAGTFTALRVTDHEGETETTDVNTQDSGEQSVPYYADDNTLEAGDTAFVAVLDGGEELDKAKVKFTL
ncbi:hypothetical protein [Natrinema thermotolerans]|uniref:hypothetical protein n=1 Tax=Natrinema thermotolerans TaxID=121872 RepID=UPI00067869BE|nr:hypothetical protein [Natrinema thermotolerans]QCC57223.1 hypothetical protein DVR14_00690 [Natrinema thermotolerans]